MWSVSTIKESISNFTTDRAMTEGLAECERLRARIAELEASAAARESLRDLMEKAAEARLSCGLYIPSDGLIASYTYGDGSNERDVLERVAEDLDDTDGAHVGAAKKGGGA